VICESTGTGGVNDNMIDEMKLRMTYRILRIRKCNVDTNLIQREGFLEDENENEKRMKT
jgi:hypothetical protein